MAGVNDRRWYMKSLSTPNSLLPTSPGLYAIGHEKKTHGLEIAREYVYVGETENLRQRMGQHMPKNERNEPLRKYLKAKLPTAKCWYTTDVHTGQERKKLENTLIRELQPEYNTKQISKGSGHG